MMSACMPTPNSVTREGVVISTNATALASEPWPMDFSSYDSRWTWCRWLIGSTFREG